MDMVLSAKTLGRRPGCVVMNIGAVMFDRTGQSPGVELLPENRFYEPISAFDSHSLALTSDPETLRWWKRQQSWQVIGEEFMNSNASVASVCDKLAEFISRHKPEKVWSNSPTFHHNVIRTLYEKTGKPFPIAYRQEMDFRTLMDLVYVNRDERPDFTDNTGYPRQHAVGDAISQARAIVRALKDRRPTAAIEQSNQRWMMVDIETLGLKPGYGIMSIGAALFSPLSSQGELLQGKNQFYTVLNSFDVQNHGFRTDPETLRWWKKEPIWKDLAAQIRDSEVTVHKACTQLASFITNAKPDKVWANSPSFDIEILRDMFKKVGVELPIAYRQETDFRTLMELAYPIRENRPEREFGGWFPAHHALGDAMEQAVQTQKAMQALGLSPDPQTSNAAEMTLIRRASRAARVRL